ncbi:acyl-CoA dehydrogenase family protein [Streptomyces sp. CA-100214]
MLDAAVIAEEAGAALAPGPFVAEPVAAAFLSRFVEGPQRGRWLADLVDGRAGAAVGWATSAGSARVEGAAIGAGPVGFLLVRVGEDVVLVDAASDDVSVTPDSGPDPAETGWVFSFDAAAHPVIVGQGPQLTGLLQVLSAAVGVGLARACTSMATEYAKVREQFGFPIGLYQAVKHHCANMLVEAELATAVVWDATRAELGTIDFVLAAANAAAVAVPAAITNAQLNIQVHGGIGFTWEHDAHLYFRRAISLFAVADPIGAGDLFVRLSEEGHRRPTTVELPQHAEEARATVRATLGELAGLPQQESWSRVVEAGFAMPSFPRPWGLDAEPALVVVIKQELAAAGIQLPVYSATAWVTATLIEHGTEDQIARWVPSAISLEERWCQLFSEPAAGSDAANVSTRAVRVDGGWRVTGQKTWTSQAHRAAWGLATVRTDPTVGKHAGITMVAIPMAAEGVDVRPLKQISGASGFNEVFLDEVFVPDSDVVGPVNGGWTVARSTLGNERLNIGSGGGSIKPQFEVVLDRFVQAAAPTSHRARVATYLTRDRARDLVAARQLLRTVSGAAPGPEGNLTKLLTAECVQEAAMLLLLLSDRAELLLGPKDSAGAEAALAVLNARRSSIAGGTSEITRNQIAERILGLPRDRRK